MDHLDLTKQDGSLICTFLPASDQYAKKGRKRGCQPLINTVPAWKFVTSVNLKFSIDGEWIESFLAQKIIKDLSAINELDGSAFHD